MSPGVRVLATPDLLRALPEEVLVLTDDFEVDLRDQSVRRRRRSVMARRRSRLGIAPGLERILTDNLQIYAHYTAREADGLLAALRLAERRSLLPLQSGLIACFALITAGLLVSSYALTTGADNLVRGLATVLLLVWPGCGGDRSAPSRAPIRFLRLHGALVPSHSYPLQRWPPAPSPRRRHPSAHRELYRSNRRYDDHPDGEDQMRS